MLIAKQLESRGVAYVIVHPISVWRGRGISEYSYAKDDHRDSCLIAELAAELHFTQARLRDPLWQTMRSLAYERFGLVELRSRARQELKGHLEVIFPNYPAFHRLSLASRAVLCGDPEPGRIAALAFDDLVLQTRLQFEGSRLNAATLKQIHAAARQSWGLGAAASKVRLSLAIERQRFMSQQICRLDAELLLRLYQQTVRRGLPKPCRR